MLNCYSKSPVFNIFFKILPECFLENINTPQVSEEDMYENWVHLTLQQCSLSPTQHTTVSVVAQ